MQLPADHADVQVRKAVLHLHVPPALCFPALLRPPHSACLPAPPLRFCPMQTVWLQVYRSFLEAVDAIDNGESASLLVVVCLGM